MMKLFKSRQSRFALGLSLSGLLVLIGLLLLPSSRLPNVVLGDFRLRSQTPAEALMSLKERSASLGPLTVTAGEVTQTWTLSELGLTVATQKTVDQLVGRSLNQNLLTRAQIRLVRPFRPLRATAQLAIDEPTLTAALAEFLAKVNQGNVDAQLVYHDGWSVIPAHPGEGVEAPRLRSAILDQIAELSTAPISLPLEALTPKITTEQATALLPAAAALIESGIRLLAETAEELTVDPSQVADWLLLVAPSANQPEVTLGAHLGKIRAYVKTLAENIKDEPVDARVAFQNNSVQITQASRNGRSLAETETAGLLELAALDVTKRTIPLPITIIKPEVTSETLQNLGLKELIGRATTSYAGSPDNRRHNIANGTKYLAGKLVKPSEEFSTVTALGAVDDTTGYLPELVIKENRTTPEYGGGLCQVSTTLFRAALDAGLKINERRNHSYRVSYYERGVGPGLDATIYLPSPDLKFLNDTPGWILIQGGVNSAKSEVTFEFYGTKDGRRSVIGKPQVNDITDPPDPIYAETADLPTGETKQIEKPHQGAKTIVTYQVYRGAELIHEQTFRSTYKAWAARYLVGTGPSPAAVPAPRVSATPSPTPEPSPSGSETPSPTPSPSSSSSSSATSSSPSPSPTSS